VVSGLTGVNFSLPMVRWVYKRMTIEGFMVGTLTEAKELMALARAGKIKPPPQGRADGRRSEMDRRGAGRENRATDCFEELRQRTRTVAMNYGDSDAVASSRGLTGKRTVTVVPRNAGHRLKVFRVFRIENDLQASCCNRATRS
jgi:hypothetical protein